MDVPALRADRQNAQRVATEQPEGRNALQKCDVVLDSHAEGIFSSSKTNRTLTMQEVARAAADPAKLPQDMEGGLVATSVYRADVENYPNGCHVCEVEIDRDTGVAEIARYTVVDDVGTVLNPMLLHGQIHGGVVQGVGQVLMEDICRDASGQPWQSGGGLIGS